MKQLLTAIIFSALLSLPARAEIVSANMLRVMCSYPSLPANVQEFAKQSCYTIIRSYLEYNAAMRNHVGVRVPFCLSEGGASLEGARATFLGYVSSNPNAEKQPAAIIFMMAMGEVSRCR